MMTQPSRRELRHAAWVAVLLTGPLCGQASQADTAHTILGTWQQGSSEPGSDLGQHFEFTADGSFVLHLSNYDDVRDIVKLKGAYRRSGDDLYFTILSRTIVQGSIDMSNPGFDLNLFTVYPDTTIEVPEVHPVELSTRCHITWFGPDHVKLNNAHYYRVDRTAPNAR